MAFEMTRNVQVRRDRNGRVRQLSHAGQPYRAAALEAAPAGLAARTITPRALAEQYLRDVAGVYELAPATMANFAASPTGAPSAAPTELRFKEEKAIGNAASVSYDQTHFGLPIWDAGMTVRIETAPMQVTGSHNAMHYEVDVSRPDPNSAYMPHRLDAEKLRAALGLGAGGQPAINATRMLIYRYTPEQRLDPQVKAQRTM